MKIKSWHQLALAAGLALALPAALAAGPVSYSKAGGKPAEIAASELPYQMSGRIDAVNLGENFVIVDDNQFVLPSGTVVHLGNKEVTVNSLQKGMLIGYTFSGDGSTATRVMTGAWILQ